MVFPAAVGQVAAVPCRRQVDGENGNPSVPFSLMLDQDLKTVNALGIPGDLAKPSTYILDKKGNAVFAFVRGNDHTDPPSGKSARCSPTWIN